MHIHIINSKNFWPMGWATDASSQQDVIASLKRLHVGVEVDEVHSLDELNALLTSLIGSDVLVWPNAYHVSVEQGSEQSVWLADSIESKGLAMIGNSARALKNVLAKSRCQQLLEQQHLAIPEFAALTEAMLADLPTVLAMRNLRFPLFVKPDGLSTSKGISQDCMVKSMAALKAKVTELAQQYGYPVMVESFLPGRDITVAVFMSGEQPTLLATYYDTEIYEHANAVLDHEIRLRDWNDGKWLRVVTEPDILAQLEALLIPACQALGVDQFTRIDCRMDEHGQIKAFDVNGLPGLELPFSTTVWQMIVKLSQHSQLFAFDTLISLVIYCAARQNNIVMPERIRQLAEDYIAAYSTKVSPV